MRIGYKTSSYRHVHMGQSDFTYQQIIYFLRHISFLVTLIIFFLFSTNSKDWSETLSLLHELEYEFFCLKRLTFESNLKTQE